MKTKKTKKILKRNKEAVVRQKSFSFGSGYFNDEFEFSQQPNSPFKSEGVFRI